MGRTGAGAGAGVVVVGRVAPGLKIIFVPPPVPLVPAELDDPCCFL